MTGDMITFDLSDVEEAVKAISDTGKSPQRAMQRAALKAIAIVRKRVNPLVPVGNDATDPHPGLLKRSLVRVGEKSRKKGKKVYDLTFKGGSEWNALLQKPIKNPGAAGSPNTKRGYAYYPASQEYGFLTRSKGNGLSYVPGYEFLKKGAEMAQGEAEQVMIDTAMKEIEKIWNK